MYIQSGLLMSAGRKCCSISVSALYLHCTNQHLYSTFWQFMMVSPRGFGAFMMSEMYISVLPGSAM
jgi:hypothetical protein